MTSLTGKTEATLAGTRDPPPFAAAIGGAVLQLGTLLYVWSAHSPAKECLGDIEECLSNFSTADPWGRLVICVELGAILCWILSLRGHLHDGFADPSIVDRLWSILPPIYCWYFFLCGTSNVRVLLMSVLATIWGSRLTYNFVIKGGFSGGEDYRWKEIRTWFPGKQYEFFALVFIHLFQLNEILAFTVPVVAAFYSDEPLGVLDAIAAVLYLGLVAFEATADRQMFAYQTEKYRRRAAGEDAGPYARGFIETGLWAYSRHPNYFAEVTMWWVFYLFSVAATGKWLNWTLAGAVFLAGLFLPPGASLDTTEALTSRKYAAYPEYQAKVSRFFPWFPKKAQGAKKPAVELA